jgi:serine protease Do
MKSHRIATFILFTFIATACASPPSRQISKPSAHLIAKSLEKSIETASSAIVVINTNIAQGSGVLLSSDGVVVTNLHVLEGAGDITVQLQSGSAFTQVDVIGFDAKRDIALLKVHGKGLPFAELSASQDLRRGRAVFTIGAPSGLTQTVSRGIVSAIRTENPEYELIQTDAAISPGSSGGGLFDDDGTLLGVVVSYRTDGQNLNFAIPAKYIMPLLDLPVSYSEAEFLAINAKTE